MQCSCARTSLYSAKNLYYAGDFDASRQILSDLPSNNTDKVLWLMERGATFQAMHRYEESTADWLNAVQLAEALDQISLSRTTESMFINDSVLVFQGAPYERTLLRTLLAHNYLAMGMWEDAAVEARNIIYRQEALEDFPDDPFSRYVAAFCFEMARNYDSAAFQYKLISKMMERPKINPHSGLFIPANTNNTKSSAQAELVCFILKGKAPTSQDITFTDQPGGYAKIYHKGDYLGRSYEFVNTGSLFKKTNEKISAMRDSKTIARIIVKDAISDRVADENEFIGELLRLILFSLETPDTRRWQTLPATFQIARLPCPEKLDQYTVVFLDKSASGKQTTTITRPITRNGRTYFSFVRLL